MDAENQKDFDASMDRFAALRSEPRLRERFDAAVSEMLPLLDAAIQGGIALASPVIPGGPLVVAGVQLGGHLLEEAIHRWIASKAPKTETKE